MTLLNTAQLEAIAHMVGVGLSVIHLVDPEDPETWRILYNNPAASAASQADLSPVIGMLFLEAFPPVRGTPLVDWYRQVLDTGETMHLPELRYGDEHVPDAAFQVRLDPLPGGCVLGQYINVTLQRRAEGELRALNQALEAKVAARTRALEISREVIRDVASASAHDLQTPLRHIRHQLIELSQVEDTRAAREAIAAAVRRIAARLDALIDYTEAFTEERPAPVEVDLSRAIQETLDQLPAPLLEGAQLEIDAPEGRWRMPAAALGTGLRELLSNALHFRAPGREHRVRLSARVDGERLFLVVSDNGRGVPPDFHDNIFRAFYQVAPDSRGIGLGLTLSRTMAEAAGGGLSVASVPGEGSTFTLTLPATPCSPSP